MTDLGVLPGMSSSSSSSINDAGQVVGRSFDDITGNTRAFLWTSDAGMVDLGTLAGFSFAEAAAVNSPGQVVGEASNGSGPVHGFLWTRDTGMTDLGTLAGVDSVHPHAINVAAAIVGDVSNGPASGPAFIWVTGVMTDLNTLIPAGSGWVLQTATGINDNGQIVGTGSIGGQTHAFLLTPVP
jgi:probable HAF family extracellular repeat protein